MKISSLIPKKVRDAYQIIKWESGLSINKPCYINIDFDKDFEIINGVGTLDIKNNKCIVSLWKDHERIHITIYS